MFPYIHVFGKQLPMYGLLAAVGTIFAVLYFKYREKGAGRLAAHLELAFLYGLVGTFIGAKLLFILTQLPQIIADFAYLHTDTQAFLQKYLYSGFVFYGGLFGGLAGVYLYARHQRLSYDALLQLLLPTVPLIHSFGRMGCFCMGCCYGKAAQPATLGLVFHASQIAPNDIPLIPVQLYEAILVFILFIVLARMAKQGKKGKSMLAVYLVAYGTIRFILEFLRGDTYRGFIGWLSISQLLSLLAICLGSWLLWKKHYKTKQHSVSTDS